MSAQWQAPATDVPVRPSLPAGAIAQANAAAASLPPAAAAALQARILAAQQAQVNGAPKAGLMSNGSVAPSVFNAASNAGSRVVSGADGVNLNGKRELSPERMTGGGMPPSKTIKSSHGEDVKPIPTPPQLPPQISTIARPPAPAAQAPRPPAPSMLPMGRGQGIDFRAEEEAAQRVARSAVGGVRYAGNASRARHTDLFGEQVLRVRLNRLAQEQAMTVDDEAMRYLALAAEIRVRALLSSAIRAQEHRVTSNHQHKPPMVTPPGSKTPRPLWSQKILADPNAVMSALANANKEENKAHRVARTERNARETEIARAQAAAREREMERAGSAPPPAAEVSPARPSDETAVATTQAGPSNRPPPPPREPTFQAAPTFGAPPPPKKTSKKKGGKKDMSVALQARSTNSTAAAQAGRKQYAWETGGAFRPQVPSLLSGKRKKGADEDKAPDAPAEAAVEPAPKRVKRVTVSEPQRREIDVDAPGDKKARDDRALTIVDMVFALEHDASSRGMGSSEEIVRRVWSRPGGPYGSS